MRVTICDLNPAIAANVATFTAGRPGANIIGMCGDILALSADAIVSPANSFGVMDGGIDLVYLRKWGWGLQDALQAAIRSRPMGELLVGEALVIPTGDPLMRCMISAPTMRVPRPIHHFEDVYLASRAAFVAAKVENFEHIVMPGMGTLTGRVPPYVAVKAMLNAFYAVFPD